MNDKKRIERFAKQMGLQIDAYSESKYIIEQAREKGAVESVSLFYGIKRKNAFHSSLNFELDVNGNCIGFSTDERQSFRKR